MEDYHIKTISTWAEIDELRAFWEKVQWHPATDFEFFNLVVKGRKNVIAPCVFVVSKGSTITTLLTGRIELSSIDLRLGYLILSKLNVRKLVIMDGGFMGERTSEIWTQLLAHISDYLPKEKLDLASLENLTLNSEQHTDALNLFSFRQLCMAHQPTEHWLLHLPKTFEEFMAGRSKKRRYWLNRLPRVLDKEYPGAWSISQYCSVSDVTPFAAAAEAIACKTYHRGLGVGFKANEEAIARLTMEARRSQLKGYVLYIKKEPVAFWSCFQYGETLYLSSTGYHPSYRTLEVGTILLLKIFQDHCGTKIQTVDFGLGDAEYKQRYGSEHYLQGTLLLFPKTLRGLRLNCTNRIVARGNLVARSVLDRANITQRIKTVWRRSKSGDKEETVSSALVSTPLHHEGIVEQRKPSS